MRLRKSKRDTEMSGIPEGPRCTPLGTGKNG